MAQSLNLKFSGLWTNPNEFSEVPVGAMNIATNVVIDKESIIDSRRGFQHYGIPLSANYIRSLLAFNDTNIALTTGSELYYDADNNGNWTKYAGTFPAPASNTKTRAIQSNKNLYFTTAEGIYKLESVTAQPRKGGAPKGLAGIATATETVGWFTETTNVGYRIVWGYRDTNNNLVLGPPSDRIIAANTSDGPKNVTITFQVPTGVDENWFYQVYRSAMSSDLNTVASDDMQQVYENNPSSLEITNREISIIDVTPDDLKQAALYTNATQEGIGNANWAPPFSKDICVYKNHAFYANTRTIQRRYFNFIAVGGTDGIQIGDTFTFVDNAGGSFTVSAGSSNNPSIGQFEVIDTLTPAENVEQTARKFAEVVNKYPSNTFINCYYTSGFDELPGQMMVEKRSLNGSTFFINSSRPSASSPRLQPTGQDVISSNDELPNRVCISKIQQPEAVPLLNYIDIGSANDPIERVLALRDGIIVLKTDGVYRISGDSVSTFRVSLIDNTVRILAKDTAVILSNQVFCLSDQGVVAITDTGAQVISRPIENLLTKYTSNALANFSTLGFAIAYESDRKYILFAPVASADTFCKIAFVYNIFTNTWTTWTKDATTGAVDYLKNKMIIAAPSTVFEDTTVMIERKDYATSDYVDEEYIKSITDITGNVVTLNPLLVKVGDVITQTSGVKAVITDVGSSTVTVTSSTGLIPGDCRVVRPIPTDIRFNKIDAENPAIMKHFRRTAFLVSESAASEISVDFESDISAGYNTVTLTKAVKGQWGNSVFGAVIWGSGSTEQIIRLETLVPQHQQRCNWLNIRINTRDVYSSLGLNGVSLIFEGMSEKFK